MGWLSKAWKDIKKPLVGALSGGVSGFLAGGWAGAAAGAIIGAAGGAQADSTQRSAEKAEKRAEENAMRQELLAATAPTTIQAPGATTQEAGKTQEDVAGARKRRYNIGRTTNSGAVLQRYAASVGRTTVG